MKSLANSSAFTAKEIMENMRTKKLLVLLCVFIFLAILSALTARFMGEIMAAVMSAEGATEMIIVLPDAVWTDSYAQLYSNLTQIGIIALIMLYMGSILREKSSGTVDLMMAKGLTPAAFVFSKFAVAAAITLLSLLVAVLVTYVYTLVLFEYGGQIGNVLFGAVPFAVFLLTMLAITMMWSAIAKSTATSAVLGLCSFFAMMLFDFVPWLGRFMPGTLLGHGVVMSAGVTPEGVVVQIVVALMIMVLALWVAVVALKRREG